MYTYSGELWITKWADSTFNNNKSKLKDKIFSSEALFFE